MTGSMGDWRDELGTFYRPWRVVDETAGDQGRGRMGSRGGPAGDGPGVGEPGGAELRGEQPRYDTPRRDGPSGNGPGARIAGDLELAREVVWEVGGGGTSPRPLFRMWTNEPCLVTTRREARLPRFQDAAEAARDRGWPVFVRDSGGTTIPHLQGSLHLSLILPRIQGSEPGTDRVYTFLCEPVREALGLLEVEAGYGVVPNSFCDGRFNLVAGGRKVAGTSQRWKGGIPGHPVGQGFILAHMTLFVEGDMAAATGEVNRFLQEAGGEGTFDPDAVVTVQALEPASSLATPSLPASSLTAPSDAAVPPAGPSNPSNPSNPSSPSGNMGTTTTMGRVQAALRKVLGS